MVEDHVELNSELRGGITHHRDESSCRVEILVIAPGLHDRAVVHAVHDHLVHASCLQSVRVLKVTRDLRRRSGGRKGAWQANQDDVLAGGALSKVDLFRGEAIVEGDARQLLAELNGRAHGRAQQQETGHQVG